MLGRLRTLTLGPAIVALPVLAAGPVLDSEAVRQAEKLRDEAVAGTGAYELLHSLTVEASPRFAGTPGDRAGVEWGLATMRRLGFEDVREQPVTVPRWVRGDEAGWILDPSLRPVVLAALGGSVGTPEPDLTAEVVPVLDLDALEKLPAEVVAGKIVFFTRRMERTREGSGYRPTVRARGAGPSAAAAKGAVGMLMRSAGTSTNRVAHTGATRYQEDVPRIPAAALSHPDADVLEARLAMGGPVRFRLRLTSRYLADARSANVIGEVRGRERPDEVVLLGCHLDSWDLGEGVVDDGAGCVIIIEAARRIGALSRRPRRTVRVVLFANEEFGLSGAKAYAEEHAGEIGAHAIGAESDLGAGRVWQFSSGVAPAALAVVEEMAAVLAPLGIERGDNEARGGADLRPLREAGMPVLSLRQDATAYFDVHHTVNDTLLQVDRRELDQNVAAYAVAAYLAADSVAGFGAAPVAAAERDVIAAMRDAANEFLASLSPEMRGQATFSMDEEERRLWSNLPATMFERKGVAFGDMSEEQRILAHELIQSPLSSQGYLKVAGIMRVDEILQGYASGARPDAEPMFGQRLYWIGIFGDPSREGPWGWQLDGHHLALNFTVVGDALSVTPAFLGSDPAQVRRELDAGLYVQVKEDRRGRRLFEALDESQRERALLEGETPSDVIAGPGRADRLRKIRGLAASEMTPHQSHLLMQLLDEYLHNLEPDLADVQAARIEAAGLGKLHFSWSGTEAGKPYYYRIHGPTVLVEFDNSYPPGRSSGPVNHIHTVWRDAERDYGEDLLRRHYEESPHHRKPRPEASRPDR
jgi:Zn-dependent M28 family amino/carboxypeptidase